MRICGDSLCRCVINIRGEKKRGAMKSPCSWPTDVAESVWALAFSLAPNRKNAGPPRNLHARVEEPFLWAGQKQDQGICRGVLTIFFLLFDNVCFLSRKSPLQTQRLRDEGRRGLGG